MIYLLTSNAIPIKSIRDYNDNFVLSLLHTEVSKVHRKQTKFYQYDIFFQEEMDTEEFGKSDSNVTIDLHEYPDITTSLDRIAEMLITAENRQLARDEDLAEEITLAICCDYDWNQQVVKYLNEYFAEQGSNLTAINLYRELHVASKDRLATTLKTVLNSEFIYPDDPIAFGYALHYALGGLL